MTKEQRQQVFDKTGGHCAYCGVKLLEENWHRDHVKPIYRGNGSVSSSARGDDTAENSFAACPRCNRWKSVMPIEVFRGEIEAQVSRLRRDSAAFRLAEDYGQVKETGSGVVFFFEK